SVPSRAMRRANCNWYWVAFSIFQDSGGKPLRAQTAHYTPAEGPPDLPRPRGVNSRQAKWRGPVNSYLDELYAHQEWADAEHWRAFEAYPAALADKAIRERLFHIHLVQHGFLWVTGPRTAEFDFKKLEN